MRRTLDPKATADSLLRHPLGGGARVTNPYMAVACRADGQRLGTVSGAQLRPDTGALMSVVFSNEEGEFTVPMSSIDLLGRDLVLLGSRLHVHSIREGETLAGRPLSTLRGLPVVTRAGEQLGSLRDLAFDRINGAPESLLLSDGRALDVQPADVLLGSRKVLVPTECAARLRPVDPDDHGLLSRMGRPSKVRRAMAGLRRVLTPAPQS